MNERERMSMHPHLADIENCAKEQIIKAIEGVAFEVLDAERALRNKAKAARKKGDAATWRRLNEAALQHKRFRNMLWFAFPPF